MIEGLTAKIYASAMEEIEKIIELGGSMKAIENGYQQREIHKAAFEYQKEIETGIRNIIGVNYACGDEVEKSSTQSIDSEIRKTQAKNISEIISKRNEGLCVKLLLDIKEIAATDENLLPKVIDAVKARCTIGEIVNAMKEVFGDYHPPSGF